MKEAIIGKWSQNEGQDYPGLWFDFKEDGTGYPYLYKTVTAQNKEDLHLVMFPNLKITFDELFDIGEY